MKIMVGVGHPKGVHFWKNIIHNLESEGHEVKIVAREKDVTLYLLNAYGFKYEVIGKNYKGLIKKAYGMFESDFKAFKIAKKFNPDILLSGMPYLAQVSKLIRKPHIVFSDTEHANLTSWLSFPFADVIMTPSCFKRKINPKKHIAFNGYFQLAYLHPNYFKPDSSVLHDLGVSKNDKFILLRFVSWRATHDIGQHGFDLKIKQRFIEELGKHCKVFITSEASLGKEFEKYKIQVSPKKVHDLLYYATLYVGEGAAMASEAAVLGTPSIFVSTLRLGYLDDLEERYKLAYSYTDQEQALKKALELLDKDDLKEEWRRKRGKLLSEMIDVTKFMTEFIENYPESFTEWKANNSKE